MKKYLKINFYTPITSLDLANCLSLMRTYYKPISYLLTKMQDTTIKEIQLTNALKKEEEALLIGILTGYSRNAIFTYHVNEFGETV